MKNGEKFKIDKTAFRKASEEFRYERYSKCCMNIEDCKSHKNCFECFLEWLDKEDKEILDDIIKEIRRNHPQEYYPAEYGGGKIPNKMRDLADRLEKALAEERKNK